ncbi:MAG: hypothetical protein ACKOZT_14895 [Cyanobium sp.]
MTYGDVVNVVYNYLPRANVYTWAQASLCTAPAAVPGPLPLFGAGAAFGFSRRLRKRIQAARPQPSAAAEG